MRKELGILLARGACKIRVWRGVNEVKKRGGRDYTVWEEGWGHGKEPRRHHSVIRGGNKLERFVEGL